MTVQKFVAEFLGTLALCLVGIMSIQSGDLLAIAFAHGLTIMVMVGAFGAVSGGHFNPAVTFGFLIAKRIDFVNALIYWAAQILGAIVGCLLIKLMVADPTAVIQAGTPAVGADFTVMAAFIAEIIGTFVLVTVVFGSAVDSKGLGPPAVCIGLSITLMILALGAISGQSINPARFLGPAVLTGGLTNAWLYIAGPLIGGALAAGIFEYGIIRKRPQESTG